MNETLDENFTALNVYLNENPPSKIFILVDENTHEYCLPILLSNMETTVDFEIIEIEAGEELKTIDTTVQLWEILAEFEADRKALLINLGGGVITDLGGFVASTYKRGIKFINIPTTLLAMCDASIGGKTGIDHQYLKNIIGTFATADKVFTYPKFLKTLPALQIKSGFAEMLKHALIADDQHWNDLINIVDLSAETVASYILRSMEIKQMVVGQDFKEQNVRKTLNFGHTIGHAVESLFLQNALGITHGEAVAIGMICESKIAEVTGLLTTQVCDDIVSNILKFFPAHDISRITNEQIVEMMNHDKKNTNGNIQFSLIDMLGHCNFNVSVDTLNIHYGVNFYRGLSNH